MISEYQTPEHALAYLAKADSIPHRTEGERHLLELLPPGCSRVLDLGTGDGRLASLVQLAFPSAAIVATDFSSTMLEAARVRFVDCDNAQVIEHDLNNSLSSLGQFDAVVSSFAIHHVEDERKQSLFREIFECLTPGGVFCNLEHVASRSEAVHDRFLLQLGITREQEDQSNRCTLVEPQLRWLEESGFVQVDCYWKWYELALLVGFKPCSSH